MKSKYFAWLRNLTAFSLMLAVFTATSLITAASPEKSSSMGEIVVTGKYLNGAEPAVILNGEKAYNGRTFFSTGTVVTPDHTNAVLKLGKAGYIDLAPNSTLTLNFDKNSISGELSAGHIRVVNTEGIDVMIKTADKTYVNKAAGNGIFTVSTDADASRATSETGSLYVTNGTSTVPVQDDDDDDGVDDAAALVPVFILAGLVGIAAWYVTTNGDDNNGAFVSGTR